MKVRTATGDPFPLKDLAKLTLKVDGQPEKEWDPTRPGTGGSFQASLKPLQRGKTKVVVTATTRTVPSVSNPETLTLVFAPERPRIEYTEERRPKVKQEFFNLRAKVCAQLIGEKVLVTIRHLHGGKILFEETTPYEITPEKPLTLTRKFSLKEKMNRIQIEAVNQGALPGQETDRLDIEVTQNPKDQPPTIAFDKLLLPLSNGKVEAQSLKAASPEGVVVDVPRVRLVGTVRATAGKLLAAYWLRPGVDVRLAGSWTIWGNRFEVEGPLPIPPARLAGFTADTKQVFSFQEVLELKPGPQTFHFRPGPGTARMPTSR